MSKYIWLRLIATGLIVFAFSSAGVEIAYDDKGASLLFFLGGMFALWTRDYAIQKEEAV